MTPFERQARLDWAELSHHVPAKNRGNSSVFRPAVLPLEYTKRVMRLSRALLCCALLAWSCGPAEDTDRPHALSPGIDLPTSEKPDATGGGLFGTGGSSATGGRANDGTGGFAWPGAGGSSSAAGGSSVGTGGGSLGGSPASGGSTSAGGATSGGAPAGAGGDADTGGTHMGGAQPSSTDQ